MKPAVGIRSALEAAPNAPGTAIDFFHAGLILLSVALLAGDNLVHYPIALMALLGLIALLRQPARLLDVDARPLFILFGALWLPMLFATLDAAAPSHSRATTALYTHFLLAAWYLMNVCSRPRVARMVAQGTAVLVLFAGCDAALQFLIGRDLFGYPYDGGILKGVFYPKQRLALLLAVLAPVYLAQLRCWRCPPALALVVHATMLLVILLAAKRAAWLMLLPGLFAYLLLWRARQQSALPWRYLICVLGVLCVLVVGSAQHPVVQNRFDSVSGLVSGDPARFDAASGYRLSLWRSGVAMFEQHWVNGIGPRGFRHAYSEYAAADDFWMRDGRSGQTHPHLLLLEVACETGVLGLCGLGLFYLVLWRLMWRSRTAGGAPLWLLCAGVASLPWNAHMAFYGSYWASVVWLLVGTGLGALRARS